MLSCTAHATAHLSEDLGLVHLQHVLHVARARRDEHVDPGAVGVPHSLIAAVDVCQIRTGEAADDRAVNAAGDRAYRLEFALARDREAGFEVIDPETGELLSDLEFVHGVKGDAGSLLTVSQRGVEDDHLAGILARCVVGAHRYLVGLSLMGSRLRATKNLPAHRAQEVMASAMALAVR